MNFICDHPDIRAISFVGGDPAGRHIYNRGSANGKRVQVLLRLSNLTLTLTIMFSVVQHGGQEPWSDHARCQQGICCQPGAWLIFIPFISYVGKLSSKYLSTCCSWLEQLLELQDNVAWLSPRLSWSGSLFFRLGLSLGCRALYI